MIALLFDLSGSAEVRSWQNTDYPTSFDRAAVFAKRPGFAKLNAFGFLSGWIVSCRFSAPAMGGSNLQCASSSPWKACEAYSIDPPSSIKFVLQIASPSPLRYLISFTLQ